MISMITHPASLVRNPVSHVSLYHQPCSLHQTIQVLRMPLAHTVNSSSANQVIEASNFKPGDIFLEYIMSHGAQVLGNGFLSPHRNTHLSAHPAIQLRVFSFQLQG